MKNIFLVISIILFSCKLSQAQNVGIGTPAPSEKLHVAGNIKADTAKLNVLKITQNAGVLKVLTSDISGNGSWQALPASLTKITSAWKGPLDAPSRDTSIDGTLTKVYFVSAPELTASLINTASINVYMRVGGIGPFLLPYISNAGGRANAVQAFYMPGKIGIIRPTFNEVAPNNINLPATLQFRYTIIQ